MSGCAAAAIETVGAVGTAVPESECQFECEIVKLNVESN